MAAVHIDSFLSESVIARKARVPIRVVFRTTRMTPQAIESGLTSGELLIDGERRCDLVAGGVVIASGAIADRDGRVFFEAEETT